MIVFLRAHKRLMGIMLSWAVFCVLWLIPNRREGPFYFLFFSAIFLMLIGSQLFWIGGVLDLTKRLVPGSPRRVSIATIAIIAGLFLLAYNLPGGDSAHLTPRDVLFVMPFSWWFVGSMAAFALVAVFWTVDRTTRAAAWVYRQVRSPAAGHAAIPTDGPMAQDRPSRTRRQFLKQTAVVVSAVPFAAAGYGLLYGRLDVQITRLRIALTRLPESFEDFRIALLSDFHISPFMTGDDIRRCTTIANGLEPDLVVLIGDFLGDDPTAEGAVVEALSALKARFGVFGCLGNHEIYTETEDSITRLFSAQGIRILRQERAALELHGAMLNLIGVDYQTVPHSRDHGGHVVDRYLSGSEELVMPEMVNILLSHNPNTFDRAAELGIDLTLAGHTHGGQLSLDFVHRSLSLASIQTPYVGGRYAKPGGQQLYVSRGIGTTGLPIRFGSPPEIALLQLVRKA